MTFASLRLIRKRPFIDSVLGIEWLQAIGSEVAAETSRSAEMKAPANRVADSRAEMKEANIGNPLGILRTRPSGPCRYRCMGRANSELSLFYSDRRLSLVENASAPHLVLGKNPNCRSAGGEIPAVRVQHLADHVAGVLAGEEQEAWRHFVRLSRLAHRRVLDELGNVLRIMDDE